VTAGKPSTIKLSSTASTFSGLTIALIISIFCSSFHSCAQAVIDQHHI
jgi:hypothetical protein